MNRALTIFFAASTVFFAGGFALVVVDMVDKRDREHVETFCEQTLDSGEVCRPVVIREIV